MTESLLQPAQERYLRTLTSADLHRLPGRRSLTKATGSRAYGRALESIRRCAPEPLPRLTPIPDEARAIPDDAVAAWRSERPTERTCSDDTARCLIYLQSFKPRRRR